jgi:hypothetical protein
MYVRVGEEADTGNHADLDMEPAKEMAQTS